MNRNPYLAATPVSFSLLLAGARSLLACGCGSSAAPGNTGGSGGGTGASFTGKVLTGSQPVSGASVQLYAASNSGYGAAGAALLPSAGYSAPAQIHLAIKRIDGVAYTSGTDIVASASWCLSQKHGEAIGSLVHEMVHVVQQYRQGHAPGWLVEGLADYIRWFRYEPQSHGADVAWARRQGKNFSPRYDGSYRVSANFLNWVSEKYDPDIVPVVNASLRDNKYADALWTQRTGKTVQALGAEWSRWLDAQIHTSASVARTIG